MTSKDDSTKDVKEDVLERLTTGEREVVQRLRELHSHHAEIERQFESEQRELRRKYEARYEPLYSKRAAVLTEDSERLPDHGTTIPNFWLTAMKTHPMLAD